MPAIAIAIVRSSVFGITGDPGAPAGAIQNVSAGYVLNTSGGYITAA
jgi:hypothetical protein